MLVKIIYSAQTTINTMTYTVKFLLAILKMLFSVKKLWLSEYSKITKGLLEYTEGTKSDLFVQVLVLPKP